MGIVQNQSIKNSIITFIGFGLGAINALFFYTHFLGKLHYGIVNTLLSGANILMPIMAFGAHNTLIRFFSSYKTEEKKERFLSFMLVWPLFMSIPLFFLYFLFYNHIVTFGIDKNPEMRPVKRNTHIYRINKTINLSFLFSQVHRRSCIQL